MIRSLKWNFFTLPSDSTHKKKILKNAKDLLGDTNSEPDGGYRLRNQVHTVKSLKETSIK